MNKLYFIIFIFLIIPQLIFGVEINSDNSIAGVSIIIPTVPINFSEKNVNDSQFLNGFSSDEFWQTANAQTGLTGDKTGSFNIDTTGLIKSKADNKGFFTGANDDLHVFHGGNDGWVLNSRDGGGINIHVSAAAGDTTFNFKSPGLFTSSTGLIDFDNENLITTGIGTFGNLQVDNININGNVISSFTGTTNFLGSILVTNKGTFSLLQLDTLSLSGNVISDSTGIISFDNDNLITLGFANFGSGVFLGTGANTPFIGGDNPSTSNARFFFSPATGNSRVTIIVRPAGTSEISAFQFRNSEELTASSRLHFVAASNNAGILIDNMGTPITNITRLTIGESSILTSDAGVNNNNILTNIDFSINDIVVLGLIANNVQINKDNFQLNLGAMADSSIYYDGTDMIINPKEVGIGELIILGDLNVTGNITSENVFIPQYIFPHTNETIPVLGVGTWTNITFDQEVTAIKFGITHDHDDNNNASFAFTQDGIYEIEYDLDIEDTSPSSTDVDVAARLIYGNGTEVLGSLFETDITKKDIEIELIHSFLGRFLIDDVVTFQFTASNVGVVLQTHGTFGDHEDSATIIIKKIANLPA